MKCALQNGVEQARSLTRFVVLVRLYTRACQCEQVGLRVLCLTSESALPNGSQECDPVMLLQSVRLV